jgi:hypothetical protein
VPALDEVNSDDDINTIFESVYLNRYENAMKNKANHFTKKGLLKFFEDNKYPL